MIPAFETKDIDPRQPLESIADKAREAMPLCRCEGLDSHTEADLLMCPKCFYTCCRRCNRKEHDGLLPLEADVRHSARGFIEFLARYLPPALKFGVADMDLPAFFKTKDQEKVRD